MDSFLPILPSPGDDGYHLPPVDPDHAIKLANHLAGLYVSGSITDISVNCGDETFNLHAPVLSNGSGYFRRVLSDENAEISLEFDPNIEVSTFRTIVDSLYTGVVENITLDNVTAILEASHHMEVDHATEACTEFMLQNLDLDNCLNYWLSATLCGNEEVRSQAIGLIGRHLDDVSQSPQFLGLQSHTVQSILSDDKLQVSSEVRVYEAGMTWLKFDAESRENQLNIILKAIRLPLLPVKYLVNVVGKEDMIEENSDAMRVYSRALKSQLGHGDRSLKARHNAMNGVKAGFEKIGKKFNTNCQKPIGGFFDRTCKGNNEETSRSRNLLEVDEFVESTESTKCQTHIEVGCGKGFEAVSSKLKDAGEEIAKLELGTRVQDGLSSLRSSLQKLGEKVKVPETDDNPDQVGGIWMSVDTDIAREASDDVGEVEEEPMQTDAAVVNDDDDATGASYQEEQFLADCNDEGDEKNSDFDIPNDDEELKNSVSITKPLEDVPEGNEEELSEEDTSFNMDNLSLEPDLSNGKDDEESKLSSDKPPNSSGKAAVVSDSNGEKTDNLVFGA